MRTRADATAGITGTKQWITNGSHAATFIVFARDGRATRPIAPSSSAPARPGFSVTREEEKLGPALLLDRRPRASRTRPASGSASPAAGMRIALATLDGGRIGIAAQAVGIAQAALDARGRLRPGAHTRSAARSRGFQAIQHKLADMQTEIEAARALVWRAARLQGGRPAAHGRGRAGQALRLRASRATRPARRSRSSAATATRRSSRPSATTATPRSPRSTRARARSSGS